MYQSMLPIAFLLFSLVVLCYGEYSLPPRLSKNFLSVSRNKYGHRELRIAFRHVLVLETSAFWNTPNDVTLRQVTDGRRFVQSVHQNGTLTDCEYTESPQSILFVIDEFMKAKQHILKIKNTSVFRVYDSKNLLEKSGAYRPITHKAMLKKFRVYVDVKKQARLCHSLHRRKYQDNLKTVNKSSDFLRYNVTKGVQSDVSSQNLPHRPKRFVTLPFLRSASDETSSSRSKRGLFSGWLIFPGTKWCGTGDIADNYDDLGYDESTDTCCRNHDNCPHLINRFSWKYNMFNYHFHTMSMCVCDNRFRKCLRKSPSPTAKMVGKIYFNVIGPQCFKLKRQKTCQKRNWWGMCKKYKKERFATLKDQKPF